MIAFPFLRRSYGFLHFGSKITAMRCQVPGVAAVRVERPSPVDPGGRRARWPVALSDRPALLITASYAGPELPPTPSSGGRNIMITYLRFSYESRIHLEGVEMSEAGIFTS
jgi:hypothetical protein